MRHGESSRCWNVVKVFSVDEEVLLSIRIDHLAKAQMERERREARARNKSLLRFFLAV
jgi:hypothetical protein